MKKIETAEPFDRGFYAGPFGWISGGASEFAVAIRSALMHPASEVRAMNVCPHMTLYSFHAKAFIRILHLGPLGFDLSPPGDINEYTGIASVKFQITHHQLSMFAHQQYVLSEQGNLFEAEEKVCSPQIFIVAVCAVLKTFFILVTHFLCKS